jgi:hypothetical protein
VKRLILKQQVVKQLTKKKDINHYLEPQDIITYQLLNKLKWDKNNIIKSEEYQAMN